MSTKPSCPRSHESVVRNNKGDCIECNRERAREWRVANPEKSRANGRRWASENPEAALNARLLRDYGISLAEYRALELKQGGVCAICLQPEVNKSRLVVDHDHETGRVRGLLCSNCNVALGMFRDDMRVIESALSYLENGDCYGPLVTY